MPAGLSYPESENEESRLQSQVPLVHGQSLRFAGLHRYQRLSQSCNNKNSL